MGGEGEEEEELRDDEKDQTISNFQLISLLSLPLPAAAMMLYSPKRTAGMATPPLHALASVPFKWEEKPGKPRRPWYKSKQQSKNLGLELPPCPRMANSVLDVGSRHKFSSLRLIKRELSFDTQSSSSSEDSNTAASMAQATHKAAAGFFGFRNGRKLIMKRNASFSSAIDAQQQSSRLWEGIYEGLKQKVLTWKSRKSKRGQAHV